MNKAFALVLILVITISFVLAHGEEQNKVEGFEKLTNLSLRYFYITSIIMILASLISFMFIKNFSELHKKIAFWIIVVPVILTTIFLVFSTIYLNITSPTHGPVHWHADFEIMICDKEYEIKDPTGLFNRIGTSSVHEHNDMRIHIEGTPSSFEDIELGEFFEALGGNFDETSLTIPTNEGFVSIKNGDLCNNKLGRLMLFVQGQEGRERKWRFESMMGEYIIAPYSNVPPGDRLLIIFSEKSEQEILDDLIGGMHG